MALVGFGDRQNWKQLDEAEVTLKIHDPQWFDLVRRLDLVRSRDVNVTQILVDNFLHGFSRGVEVGYYLGLAAAREELAKSAGLEI